MWPILSIIFIVIISKSIISKVIKSNAITAGVNKYLLDINFILNILQDDHWTIFCTKNEIIPAKTVIERY